MRSPVGLISDALPFCVWTIFVPIFSRIAGWTLRFWLWWLALLLAITDTFSTLLNDICASVLGMQPCKTYKPKESAIFIVGAGEGEHVLGPTLMDCLVW